MSAFVAFALALGGLCLWGLPQLSVLFWLILVVRVVNRTTGLPAGVLDAFGVLGLGLWLSYQGGWGYGVITALAFLLDAQLPARAWRQLAFAVLALVGAALAAILGGNQLWSGGVSLWGVVIALGGTALFLPLILESRTVDSVGDRTGKPLQSIRVQAAQILALVSGVGTALLGGTAALVSLTPLWAATLGASLHWLYRTLTR